MTAIFVFGDVSGIGWSALLKASIDLKIIEVEVTLEGGTAHLDTSCGAGPGLQKTGFNVQQGTVSVEITIAWVIDIESSIKVRPDFGHRSQQSGAAGLRLPGRAVTRYSRGGTLRCRFD